MKKIVDITGKTFGRLKVVKMAKHKKNEFVNWWCECACGNKVCVRGNNLKSGTTRSCGCLRKESIRKSKNTQMISWRVMGNITEGVTNNHKRFIIDTEDLNKVRDFCWRVHKHGYVVANGRNGTNKTVKIHQLIIEVPDSGFMVDHIDQNKLNNTKKNLRVATKSENNTNIKRKNNNTSGYTGVQKLKTGKYVSGISKDKKFYHLGTFSTFEKAVIERHNKEMLIHGEFSGEHVRKDYNKIFGDTDE